MTPPTQTYKIEIRAGETIELGDPGDLLLIKKEIPKEKILLDEEKHYRYNTPIYKDAKQNPMEIYVEKVKKKQSLEDLTVFGGGDLVTFMSGWGIFLDRENCDKVNVGDTVTVVMGKDKYGRLGLLKAYKDGIVALGDLAPGSTIIFDETNQKMILQKSITNGG